MKEIFRDERPDITKEGKVYAIKTKKNGNAAGPDELTADILKLIENILVGLFNIIY